MHAPGVEARPMKTIDGESHFCEVFLEDVRVPITNRVGDENDGWRVTNVTLRFERGTAFAQHIITLRSQLRRLIPLAGDRADDAGFRRHIGRIDAGIDALWRMTQRCVTEADATGVPSPMGSAVKLGYSELGQDITKLGMQLLGRRALANDGPDTLEAQLVHDYLWSFQYTIAAGTSQIQRNLIAERILGMPKGR
jgi:alkylation response protein AidB-like acyl-CoA dehydrogenase